MKIHIVQKGDTIWQIAQQYGVNFEELKELNSHLSSPDMIMPGMKIKIPTTSKQVKTSPTQDKAVKKQETKKELGKVEQPKDQKQVEQPKQTEQYQYQPLKQPQLGGESLITKNLLSNDIQKPVEQYKPPAEHAKIEEQGPTIEQQKAEQFQPKVQYAKMEQQPKNKDHEKIGDQQGYTGMPIPIPMPAPVPTPAPMPMPMPMPQQCGGPMPVSPYKPCCCHCHCMSPYPIQHVHHAQHHGNMFNKQQGKMPQSSMNEKYTFNHHNK